MRAHTPHQRGGAAARPVGARHGRARRRLWRQSVDHGQAADAAGRDGRAVHIGRQEEEGVDRHAQGSRRRRAREALRRRRPQRARGAAARAAEREAHPVQAVDLLDAAVLVRRADGYRGAGRVSSARARLGLLADGVAHALCGPGDGAPHGRARGGPRRGAHGDQGDLAQGERWLPMPPAQSQVARTIQAHRAAPRGVRHAARQRQVRAPQCRGGDVRAVGRLPRLLRQVLQGRAVVHARLRAGPAAVRAARAAREPLPGLGHKRARAARPSRRPCMLRRAADARAERRRAQGHQRGRAHRAGAARAAAQGDEPHGRRPREPRSGLRFPASQGRRPPGP